MLARGEKKQKSKKRKDTKEEGRKLSLCLSIVPSRDSTHCENHEHQKQPTAVD